MSSDSVLKHILVGIALQHFPNVDEGFLVELHCRTSHERNEIGAL